MPTSKSLAMVYRAPRRPVYLGHRTGPAAAGSGSFCFVLFRCFAGLVNNYRGCLPGCSSPREHEQVGECKNVAWGQPGDGSTRKDRYGAGRCSRGDRPRRGDQREAALRRDAAEGGGGQRGLWVIAPQPPGMKCTGGRERLGHFFSSACCLAEWLKT